MLHILKTYPPAEKSAYLSAIIAVREFGLMLGPMSAALFLKYGSFETPFYFYATANFVAILVFSCLISMARSEQEKTKASYGNQKEIQVILDSFRDDQVSLSVMFRFCTNCRLFFGVLSQIVAMVCLQWIMPTLALQFKELDYSYVRTGLSFGILPLIFVCFSPFVHLMMMVCA